MTAGHIAGFYHAQFSLRDPNGYPVGTATAVLDPSNIANGTTSHAHKLIAPVEVTGLSLGREIATFRGGQQILGKRQLGVNEIGTFDLTLSAFDEAFHALITGSAVDSTIASSNTVTTPNVGEGDPPQGVLLLTMGFQTTAGVNKFVTYAYHNVQISEAEVGGGSQNGGENPNPMRYVVTASLSDRTFFGLPYSATTLGATGNSDLLVRYVTAKPIALTYHQPSASGTTFTVGYRPFVSEHAGARNVFTKDGAQGHTDVSGVNTSTGAITISSATGGEKYVAVYETEFTAI